MNIECEDDCNCENVKGCTVLPMNETTRTTMLFYHNQIRSLQTNNTPKPAGLVELNYDPELEDISECWAARCSSEYSSCFYTTKFRDTSQSAVQIILDIGQTPSPVLWMQMNKVWQIQAESIRVETVSNLPEGKQLKIIHNFAQIVSDRIYSVGCAWSLMERLLTFACTYGPRGPKSSETIYKIGQPCSRCPNNFHCNNTEPFPLLCRKTTELPKTSSSPSSSEMLSYPTMPKYKTNKERFDQGPTELSNSVYGKVKWSKSDFEHVPHSLPMTAPSFTPCDGRCDVDYSSELVHTSAPTIPTGKLQTESPLIMKIIQEYLKQLPLIRPQFQSEVMTQINQIIINATSASPQLSSSAEYNVKDKSEASVTHYKVDINVNLSFPREIFTLRELFQMTEAYRTVSLRSSVTPTSYPDDPKDYGTSSSTIKPQSTRTHQQEGRVFELNTTTDPVTYEVSTGSNIYDTMRIWRKNKVDTSDSSRKKPTRSKEGSGAPLLLFFGVSVIFLTVGAFLVVLLMYILRMEATL